MKDTTNRLLLNALAATAGAAACHAPAPAAAQVSVIHATDVMSAGVGGYNVYRIPGFAVADDGSLLLFAEGRPNQSDPGAAGDIDLVMKRSTDGGQNWSALQVLGERPGFDFSDPRVVIDEVSGIAHVLYSQWPTNNGQAGVPIGLGDNSSVTLLRSSPDHGATWSGPVNLNAQVKDPAWASLNTGPGLGIQLRWQDADPSRNDRLVVPAHHRPTTYRGVALFSDDGGATWDAGSGSTPHYADESEIIELTNGDLMWDARINGSGRMRSISHDGGQTWSQATAGDIPVTAVDTGMVRYSAKRDGADRDRILYSAPLGSIPGTGNSRNNIGVWTSYDEGKTFINPVMIEAGSAAYSVIDRLDDASIGLIYEVDHNTIRYVNFQLSELEGATHSTDLTHFEDFDNPIDASKGGVGWSGGWRVNGGTGYAGGFAPNNFGGNQYDLGFTVSMAAAGGGTNTIDPGVVPNERANGIYGQVFSTETQAGAVSQVSVQRADTGTASPDSVYLHIYSDLDPTDGIDPDSFLGTSLAPQSLNPTNAGVTVWNFDSASTVLAPNAQYLFAFANSANPGDTTTARAALFEPTGNEDALAFAPLVHAAGLAFDNAGTPLATSASHVRLQNTTIARDLSTPMDLGQHGTFYTSVLISRSADTGTDNADSEQLALSLLDSAGGQAIRFGVNSDESFFIDAGGAVKSTSADALDAASTYLLLIKVLAQDETAADNTDRVYFKAFASGQTLPSHESNVAWDLAVGADANSSDLLDQIAVFAGASALWSMDELRLGNTYESVVVVDPSYALVYSAATGELAIDTLGGDVMNYVLEGTGFVEENHTAVLTGTQSSTDGVLSESSLIPQAGLLSLGQVLPANLTRAQFEAFLSKRDYVVALGAPKLRFELVYAALPGDADGDGDVDDADLGTAFSHYTGPIGAAGMKTASDGDTDGDGDVDDADLGNAFASYTGPIALASVPEPGSLALLGTAGLLAGRRRRH